MDPVAEAANPQLRTDIAFRVIADHARCLTFALTDGAVRVRPTGLRAPPKLPNMFIEPLTTPALAAKRFLGWMDEDKKIGPLKTLQGIIWREGYASGELKAHLYPDAVAAMCAWAERGIKVALYSSGSVEAQTLPPQPIRLQHERHSSR